LKWIRRRTGGIGCIWKGGKKGSSKSQKHSGFCGGKKKGGQGGYLKEKKLFLTHSEEGCAVKCRKEKEPGGEGADLRPLLENDKQ